MVVLVVVVISLLLLLYNHQAQNCIYHQLPTGENSSRKIKWTTIFTFCTIYSLGFYYTVIVIRVRITVNIREWCERVESAMERSPLFCGIEILCRIEIWGEKLLFTLLKCMIFTDVLLQGLLLWLLCGCINYFCTKLNLYD